MDLSEIDDLSIRELDDLRKKDLDEACRFRIAVKKLLCYGMTDDEAIARIVELIQREAVYKDFFE
jgi:hypothetical protein